MEDKRFKHVKYMPYIGENYGKNGQRIMVLGTKIVSTDPADAGVEANSDIVGNYLSHDEDFTEGYYSSFDRIGELIREEDESITDVWKRVLFYNHTQKVLPYPTSRPTDEQIEKDKMAFIEVLMRYKPDKLLVWGKWMYDRTLLGYGKKGQNVDCRGTWMVNTCELGSKDEHLVHLTYFNDVSQADFDIQYWRSTTRKFLASKPEAFHDPQVKTRIVRILNYLKIDYSEYTVKGDMNLADLLAKGITSGILHFVPENGIVENQRIRCVNIVATCHFAILMRELLRKAESERMINCSPTSSVMELLNPEKFDMVLSDERESIVFTPKANGHTEHATKAKKIFDTLSKMRKSYSDERSRLSWKRLEALFGIKNLRQYSKDIITTKDYVKEIDIFMNRYRQ